MKYEVVYPGSNAMLVVTLNKGEQIKAEAGAMVAISPNLTIEGNMDGGIGASLKRAALGGESLFFQIIKAEHGPGEVLLAPAALGDIKLLELNAGKDYFLQGGAFLAALGDIKIDTKMQKLSQGIFSGEGLFVLHATGRGIVASSAFGAVSQINIMPGDEYIVDNGHIVAWSGDTNYQIIKAAKSWTSSFTSGEGLACRFSGPGTVWIQTRNPQAFGGWLRRYVGAGGGGGAGLSRLLDMGT